MHLDSWCNTQPRIIQGLNFTKASICTGHPRRFGLATAPTLQLLAVHTAPVKDETLPKSISGDCSRAGEEPKVWNLHDMVLLRGMAHALLKIFPQFESGLEALLAEEVLAKVLLLTPAPEPPKP